MESAVLPLALEEIAQAAGGHLTAACNAAAVVTGPAAVDSREVAAGGVFAAIHGGRGYGPDYSPAPVAARAPAAPFPPHVLVAPLFRHAMGNPPRPLPPAPVRP